MRKQVIGIFREDHGSPVMRKSGDLLVWMLQILSPDTGQNFPQEYGCGSFGCRSFLRLQQRFLVRRQARIMSVRGGMCIIICWFQSAYRII